MKSRIYSVLALLVVSAMLLSACAVPVAAPGGDAAAAPAASGEPIELLYMTHNHAQSIPVNEAIIAEFQESHPNVKITFDNAPHYNFEQKMLTAFAGGQGPDVFWAGDWMMPQFVNNGIVAPVDPTAFGVQTQEEFVDLFEPGSLDAFTVDGSIYTGGVSEYNTFSLIYDKDDFAEAGIEPLSKDTPITWEELADIAAKLTKKDGDKVVRIGLEWPFQDADLDRADSGADAAPAGRRADQPGDRPAGLHAGSHGQGHGIRARAARSRRDRSGA